MQSASLPRCDNLTPFVSGRLEGASGGRGADDTPEKDYLTYLIVKLFHLLSKNIFPTEL